MASMFEKDPFGCDPGKSEASSIPDYFDRALGLTCDDEKGEQS